MGTLDTHAIARTLTDAGADPKLADAITAAVREAADHGPEDHRDELWRRGRTGAHRPRPADRDAGERSLRRRRRERTGARRRTANQPVRDAMTKPLEDARPRKHGATQGNPRANAPGLPGNTCGRRPQRSPCVSTSAARTERGNQLPPRGARGRRARRGVRGRSAGREARLLPLVDGHQLPRAGGSRAAAARLPPAGVDFSVVGLDALGPRPTRRPRSPTEVVSERCDP